MRLEILGGVLCDSFLKTMTTPEDMDEIDLLGTKVPNKNATVNNIIYI